MTRIEDLVRDSLRQRAEDVEPTPALWHEVDRRMARHRRFQVTAWSLAAVTAAVGLVVVPGLLGGTDPSGLEIEPMGPTGGVVPTVAVVAGSNGLDLLDLATGERTTLDVPVDGPVTRLTMRPGSTAEDFDLALVQAPDAGGATLTLVYGREGGGVISTAEESGVDGFVPTIRWSPSGDHVAYTEPGADGRVRLLVGTAPDAPDMTETGQDSESLDGFLDPRAATEVGALGSDDVLLDWVLTGQAEFSELWIRQADGTVALLRLAATEGAGGFVAASDEGPLVPDGWSGNWQTMITDVVVAVSAAPSAPTGEPPVYLLAPGTDDGPSLYWSGLTDRQTDSPSNIEVPLGSRVGEVGLDALWLDAEQDAALLGNGQQTWLLTHDGDGDFGPIVEVPDATAGALFDAPGRGPPRLPEVQRQPTAPAASLPEDEARLRGAP